MLDLLCPWDLGHITGQGNILLAFWRNVNWYVVAQILFYLAFYFVYRWLPKYRITVIALGTFAFITAAYLLGNGEKWSASSLVFPLGLWAGEHFETFVAWLKKPRTMLLTLLLTGLGLSTLFLGDSLVSIVYLRNCMCMGAILFLLYFCMFFQGGQNAAARWLGKHSAAIYLLQFIYLAMAEQTDWGHPLRICFVLAATLLTAAAFTPLFASIRRLCAQGHPQRLPQKVG